MRMELHTTDHEHFVPNSPNIAIKNKKILSVLECLRFKAKKQEAVSKLTGKN